MVKQQKSKILEIKDLQDTENLRFSRVFWLNQKNTRGVYFG